MASRPVWSGFIRFSLVSVPVKAFTATASGGGGIALNQLHAECHSRIQYKKTCPIHGEVPADQIVSGYQFAKDQYVVIDTDELSKLRPKSEKDIAINAFIKPDAIDLSHMSGKSYYLTPDGPVAQRPYSLLVRAMKEQKRFAFAQVVMFGREHIVLVRPMGKVLMMTMLAYDAELKKITEFEGDVADVELPPDELKLAKTLTDALAQDKFDLGQFKDMYAERLTKLVEAKVQGEEIVEPPGEEPPQVINLMEALKKSIAAAKKPEKPAASAKPPRLVAPGTAAREQPARKRKAT